MCLHRKVWWTVTYLLLIWVTSSTLVAYKIECQVILSNKKVLQERKRHTDRGVSSTPSAVLSGGGGVVPHLWPEGYPIPGWGGGVPISSWGRVPIPGWRGTLSLVGGTPSLAGGTPSLARVPPYPDLTRVSPIRTWLGLPPPPPHPVVYKVKT